MTRSRSDRSPTRSAGRARWLVAGALVLAAALGIAAPAFASVVTADRFIVRAEDRFDEDVYVASQRGRVEGTIDGDLIITTGGLVITGTVTGDVYVLASGRVSVEAGGTVGGSLRGVARDVVVVGAVGDDVAVAALATSIDRGPGTQVGRDLVAFGGSVTLSGAVGRDVRGRIVNASVDGAVGRDIDIAVERLVIADAAAVGGDVLYRSTREAAIAPNATIGGQVRRLPAQSNFVFGVILTIAHLVGLLGFLVLGIAALWLFRNSSASAVGAVIRHPARTFLVGLVTVVVAPLLVLLLTVSLVGLPLAAVVLLGIVVLLVLGPVPVVAAFGERLLRGRGGLFGGFVVGALLWRLGIWLIPVVGALLYLLALVWGTGAWVTGGWVLRTAGPVRPVSRPERPEAASQAGAGDVGSPVVVELVESDEAESSTQPTPEPAPPASGDGEPSTEPSQRPEPADEPPDSDEWGLPRSE